MSLPTEQEAQQELLKFLEVVVATANFHGVKFIISCSHPTDRGQVCLAEQTPDLPLNDLACILDTMNDSLRARARQEGME